MASSWSRCMKGFVWWPYTMGSCRLLPASRSLLTTAISIYFLLYPVSCFDQHLQPPASPRKVSLNSTHLPTSSWFVLMLQVMIFWVGYSCWGEGKARFDPTKLPQQMQWLPPMHSSSSTSSTESKPTSSNGFS
jgi:hypothetical protein